MGSNIFFHPEPTVNLKTIDRIIKTALEEDVGDGDITSQLTIPEGAEMEAVFVTREDIVMCGVPILSRLFEQQNIDFEVFVNDGEFVDTDGDLVKIHGNARAILACERVALNLLQRMCGIATFTRRFVKAVQHTKAQILDTRKTAPGLRVIEKYAVKTGGGRNHRMRLDDGILIKDNHIKIVGSVTEAVVLARKGNQSLKIEVECDTLTQVEEALHTGADILLLDNMTTETMRKAVELVSGRASLEASGGITLANIAEVAETGVDYISIGALTHSPPAADIGLDMS